MEIQSMHLPIQPLLIVKKTKSNLEKHKLKISLEKSMAMVKGFEKTSENLSDTFSSIRIACKKYPFENVKKMPLDNDMKKCLSNKCLWQCSSPKFCQS